MLDILPTDIIGYLRKFIDYDDWNSILRTSKTINRNFKPIFSYKRYKKIGCLFFKGTNGSTRCLYDISMKDTVYRLKMMYIKKVYPEWKGRKGETNLFLFLRFIWQGMEFDNKEKLEKYARPPSNMNYATIHVVGTFGTKASPLSEDLQVNFDYDLYNHF